MNSEIITELSIGPIKAMAVIQVHYRITLLIFTLTLWVAIVTFLKIEKKYSLNEDEGKNSNDNFDNYY